MGLNIKSVIKTIKNPYWRARSKYIKFVDNLPIDDKLILLESQHGREFNGNIFSIAQYLSSNNQYKNYTICLSCAESCIGDFEKKLEQYGIENIKLVVLSSEEYVRTLASAKYLINDNTFLPYYIKKEGQVYFNTWHGTPLKSLGKKIKNDAFMIGNAQKNFMIADYLLFTNKYTSEHIIEDYMLANVSKAKLVYGGYPRNDIFFNEARRQEIKEKLNISDKKIYAYMPTFRGTARDGMSTKNDAYFLYYLYELDRQLNDDEVLYLNLHPVAKNKVNFKDFDHIKNFPKEYDTYDFLNVADVLVSDYSSVFFDFACTKKKVVLFTYDKEDYLRDRGLYLSFDELPFPQANDVPQLLQQLRCPKQYDDKQFLDEYCLYDNANATAQVCDFAILGKNTGLTVEDMPNNGKENVFFYAGNLAPNGVTASLRNLLSTIDLDERNYYISFAQSKVKPYADTIFTFPSKVNYYSTAGELNLTIFERIVRKLFKEKIINTKLYMKLCGRRVKQGLLRDLGETNFNTVIQFSGYAPEIILKFSEFDGRKIIYVHSDMLQEIKNRGNQRLDTLRYAYQKYDKVAVVTEDIIPPTYKISQKDENIQLAKNAIPYKNIIKRSKKEPQLDSYTQASIPLDEVMDFINDKTTVKFISVGRFSPEKGHERLVNAFSEFSKDHPDARLLIVGGSSYGAHYEKLKKHINDIGMQDKILLLLKVSNPYAIIKCCDYFILSSFYEGFGLVLVEADIVGLPVVSTNISGPQGFMTKYGGTMVDNSQDGLLDAFKKLYNGEIKPMHIDYEKYNQEVIEEFEKLFE